MRETKSNDHIVQFYEAESFLYRSVATYAEAGLSRGEGVILIATQEHISGIKDCLIKSELNVDVFIQKQQLICLDAQATLDKFMIDGAVDPIRFERVVAQTLDEMIRTFPLVRVYGEMVNLLWQSKNVEATVELEKNWNELCKTKSFSLLCGYMMGGFDHPAHATAFQHICHHHTHVVPSESVNVVGSDQAHLRLIAELQQRTMALQTEMAERRSIEMELKEAKEFAEAANLSKSRFLANMSHELRTPLGAMIGFADLLLDSQFTSSEKCEWTRTIIRNGKHLARLINDLLDLSKAESENLQIEKVRFSISELLSEVISLMGLKAREKGLVLQTDIESSVPKIVESDPTRLRQILVNIIGNAIKFTDRGNIKINVTGASQVMESGETHSLIEFAIRDTGIGLSPHQAKHIFEPFTQGDASTNRTYGGTGLGLYLSRQLSHALGGELSLIESQPGVGSTFVCRIDGGPVIGAGVKLNSIEPRVVTKRFEGKRILLVDDSDDNLYYVSYLLKELGSSVDTATNGLMGLRQAQTEVYDAILLDIQMPGMDGFEVIRTLRKSGLKTPILAITAHALKSDREDCLHAGFDGHIGKPVDRARLHESLSAALSRP